MMARALGLLRPGASGRKTHDQLGLEDGAGSARELVLGWSRFRESFLSERSLHGWPASNPVEEGSEPWPSAHVDLVNFRPIQDRVGISVSDSEGLTRQIRLIPKLAVQDVKAFR